MILLCRLRPSTKKVLSLAAELKALEKDKEHLRINLNKAEEEVITKTLDTGCLLKFAFSLSELNKIFYLYRSKFYLKKTTYWMRRTKDY